MANTAILFVHGFMGSHWQFAALAELLGDCDYDLFFHVLPGHETTLSDFRGTGARKWQKSVDDRLRKLSSEYDKVLLVGHSMGGLLALRAAIAVPEKVCGVVAIGFPIKINVGRKWFELNAQASKPAIEGEDLRITVARYMAGVKIRGVGEYISTLPQNAEFLKTMRLAKRDLHLLKAPMTLVNFEKDEIVDSTVPEYVLSQKPDAKIVLLPDSYHFLFTAEELPKIADELRALL